VPSSYRRSGRRLVWLSRLLHSGSVSEEQKTTISMSMVSLSREISVHIGALHQESPLDHNGSLLSEILSEQKRIRSLLGDIKMSLIGKNAAIGGGPSNFLESLNDDFLLSLRER
jgi:hypothetical protein